MTSQIVPPELFQLLAENLLDSGTMKILIKLTLTNLRHKKFDRWKRPFSLIDIDQVH